MAEKDKGTQVNNSCKFIFTADVVFRSHMAPRHRHLNKRSHTGINMYFLLFPEQDETFTYYK